MSKEIVTKIFHFAIVFLVGCILMIEINVSTGLVAVLDTAPPWTRAIDVVGHILVGMAIYRLVFCLPKKQ